MTPLEQRQIAVAAALRIALAAVICLAITEFAKLGFGYLSVASAVVVNLQYASSPFQKGLERLLGRIGGVLFGAVLVIVFRDRAGLLLTFLLAQQMLTWYVQSSGRLAYAAVHMGIFAPVMVAQGMSVLPGAVWDSAIEMALQVILGVVAADVVNGLFGSEPALLPPIAGPIFPVRADWVTRSLRITVTSGVAVLVASTVFVDPIPATVSAMILATAPNWEAMEHKWFDRALAPIIVCLFGVAILLVLQRLPYFSLQAVFLFLGIFLAAYHSKTNARHSYIGLQIGIALPMAIVSTPDNLHALSIALDRLIGVLVGGAVALAVLAVWPTLSAPAPQPTGAR